MCKDCKHWQSWDVFLSQGLRFAGCDVKPKWYATQDVYECKSFEKKPGVSDAGKSL
jgi:hypothetical protein